MGLLKVLVEIVNETLLKDSTEEDKLGVWKGKTGNSYIKTSKGNRNGKTLWWGKDKVSK